MSTPLIENNHFIVKSSAECRIPGYYILFPKLERYSIAEMEADELVLLGEAIKATKNIINATIQPEKIYLLSFCEILPTFHLHIFPRTKQMAEDYNIYHQLAASTSINGALLFDWARKYYL